MPAQPKLSPERWAEIRATWEADPRSGFSWVVAEMGLPVSAPAVRKVAVRDGWAKASGPAKTSPAKVSETFVGETFGEGSKTGTDGPERRAVGRPSLYMDEFAEQAYRLCLLGATDAEVGEFFGVSEQTINNWKASHPEFLESIKAGKAPADAAVAESLFKRAIGYSHPDVHVSNFQGVITITNLTKHYPPDTAAAFIWLKNRRPDMWRDRIEAGLEVSVDAVDGESLAAKFIERMNRAREKQQAIIEARVAGIDAEEGGRS